jgi:hypothetical protein
MSDGKQGSTGRRERSVESGVVGVEDDLIVFHRDEVGEASQTTGTATPPMKT